MSSGRHREAYRAWLAAVLDGRRVSLFKKRSHKAGMPPGALVAVDVESHPVAVETIAYSPHIISQHAGLPQMAATHEEQSAVTWINVNGLSDLGVLESIGERYQVHQLVLEDILNTDQRPKIEEPDNHLFVVVKMLDIDPVSGVLSSEQVSFILGERWLISFQEHPGDVFDAVRQRLHKKKGRVRSMGADYLLYSLLDAIVDRYFYVMEITNDKIEQLEEQIYLQNPATITPQLHAIRRNLIVLRRAIWPLREHVTAVMRSETGYLSAELAIYLRDLHDHLSASVDALETFREMLTSLADMHAAFLSARMNEIMKVLTIISTIFIPLSFFTGLYGMNFVNMPILHWHYGYYVVLGGLSLLGLGMLWFVRSRKWL